MVSHLRDRFGDVPAGSVTTSIAALATIMLSLFCFVAIIQKRKAVT